MSISIVTRPVPIAADDAGVLRVGGTRVSLDSVLIAFNEGATPEEIVQQYDTLSLADVYAALGCYLENRHQLDGYLARRCAEREQLRQEVEAKHDPRGIRERLLARRKQS
jgi:uncharacterized protein (DUF433 family)